MLSNLTKVSPPDKLKLMLTNKVGITITSSSVLYVASNRQYIKCEDKKRSFYTKESEITPVTGAPTEPQVPKLIQDEQNVESFLESKLKVAREELFKYLDLSKQVYIDKSKEYYDAERQVLSTASSLHDKREEFFPNSLYVLTGALFGTVLTRRRNFFFKIIAPIACGLVSFKIFFPITYTNVFGYLDNAEKEQLPDFYSKQTELINQTEDLVKKTSETAESSSKEISNYFEHAKKVIGEYTGLNIDQTITEKKK
ncbi:hypothetical protein C6P42_004503 [Pichia californica]|nr:hypothetical protein C6P42_004503 [[Candida] californica]